MKENNTSYDNSIDESNYNDITGYYDTETLKDLIWKEKTTNDNWFKKFLKKFKKNK